MNFGHMEVQGDIVNDSFVAPQVLAAESFAADGARREALLDLSVAPGAGPGVDHFAPLLPACVGALIGAFAWEA
jgi:hypothetical protein